MRPIEFDPANCVVVRRLDVRFGLGEGQSHYWYVFANVVQVRRVSARGRRLPPREFRGEEKLKRE